LRIPGYARCGFWKVDADLYRRAGGGDELMGEIGGLSRRDHPADDVAAEDVEDDVEVEADLIGQPLEVGDVPAPEPTTCRLVVQWSRFMPNSNEFSGFGKTVSSSSTNSPGVNKYTVPTDRTVPPVALGEPSV
jgi:hypothetical protein